ncbi:ArsR family transcriptional regulator [Streptomyces ambofaciens]|uniref:ArsR family transcriptional regulator n=2 Tax=Streptomyces ambofaciens TaxID=1889 RepID=A0ABN4PL60_STRAM|nr:helix-turn-helix domain-containing protein [Streptomyces ambofaciens]ANB10343.1 ArsR family transcriptional regulator [Streptomyces ambofaciens]CAJ88212.1 putative transcriptional regulator [Streptomyces ambofaciens ATCC 23877]
MLQVDFDEGALARLRVARGADPLWETVLSLHLLQTGQESLAYDGWRREVRGALHRTGLADDVRALMPLCPPTGYFPDFLTPGRGDLDLEDGVDRVRSTPRRRLVTELSRLCTDLRGPVPRSVRWVATGDATALRWLGSTLRRYHAVAVAPYLPAICARAGADRARRTEAVLGGGAEALLADYAELPGWRRQATRLAAPYPERRLLRLRGRPLTLVPGFFCVRAPLVLVDESLPLVLVHPLPPAPGWLPRLRAGTARPSVAQLIGASRARMLETLGTPMTTTALAAALSLAPSTASRHAAVLREAGLVAAHREGNRVLHRRTALGGALLDGAAPAAGAAPYAPRGAR